MEKIIVTKASGEQAPFVASKLKNSLRKSGADAKTVNEIIEEVKGQLYMGISTKIIYKKAFDLLKEKSGSFAARYKLKSAILELGPTGYPFEKYFAEVLKFNGYKVKIQELIRGNCANHEVDILAEKDKKIVVVECKFHSERGNKSDIKIPLYVHARYEDIKKKIAKNNPKDIEGWLVTNTRFTSDASKYGTCVGLKLISWDTPENDSLRNMIDQASLHPITSLSTLTNYEKQAILDRGIVLCLELSENPDILSEVAIPNVRAKKIVQELRELCN